MKKLISILILILCTFFGVFGSIQAMKQRRLMPGKPCPQLMPIDDLYEVKRQLCGLRNRNSLEIYMALLQAKVYQLHEMVTDGRIQKVPIEDLLKEKEESSAETDNKICGWFWYMFCALKTKQS